MKKIRKPQHAYLLLRWLEQVGNDSGNGTLFQWYDKDFSGDGVIEKQCKASGLICRVDLEPEHDSAGVQRFRLSQEGAGHVQCKFVADSSESEHSESDESDVPTEFRTNVTRHEVYIYITSISHHDYCFPH